MKRDSRLAGQMCTVLVTLSALLGAPAQATPAASATSSTSDNLTFTLTAEHPLAAPPLPLEIQEGWFPRGEAVDLDKAAATSIPSFTRSVVARGKTYKVTLVGSDPFVKGAPKVTVPMQIVPVRFEFDGVPFDPTLPGPACAGGGSALSRVLESPIVQSVSYGDGKRQYEEEFRRLEFWSLTGAPGAINPGYSVRLAASVLPTVVVKVNGYPTQEAPCGRVGFFDFDTWDNMVQKQILPTLHGRGVNPRTFPLFLFFNVLLFDGDPKYCCTLGYHYAFNAFGGVQTYAVADYDVSQRRETSKDIGALSHELAEWYDDPFINNPTPPWGRVGQIPDSCENLLEVGDPLSGTLHTIAMPNGFTYHPQELAFLSWFYDQVPSLGFKGWYSSGGTFRNPAPLCR